MNIRQEQSEDWWEVEALFDLCFAPGREALSSYRLRDGVAAVASLCFVARDTDDILAGAVRVWPVRIADHDVLLLGPIAVHPTRQGEGLAGGLIDAVVERATADGWARILLVGDAPYYARHGFAQLTGIEMPPPTNPERVLGRALVPAAWDGIQGCVEKSR